MRGQDAIVAMRSTGRRPAAVFVHLLDAAPQYGPFTVPEPLSSSELPAIDIVPPDEIGALDLRCLIGLRVIACGRNKARMGDFCRRVVQFDPAEILIWLPDTLVRWRAGHYETLPLEAA